MFLETHLMFAVTVIVIVSLFYGATADENVKINIISVPAVADTRQPTRLYCSYKITALQFFSFKWYLDDREFFRFMPNHIPRFSIFPMSEFELEPPDADTCDGQRCSVSLTMKTFNGSGTYSCEISTEGPTFRTAAESRNMTVMTLPRDKPRLEGMKSTYDIGEDLMVKCTSSPSVPQANIVFYVNELEIHESYYNTVVNKTYDGFITAVSLKMTILRKHFLGALLRVKCVSIISQVAATKMVAEVTATLPAPQTLHIQKLEWPSNSSGKISFSALLLQSSIVFWISYMKYR